MFDQEVEIKNSFNFVWDFSRIFCFLNQIHNFCKNHSNKSGPEPNFSGVLAQDFLSCTWINKVPGIHFPYWPMKLDYGRSVNIFVFNIFLFYCWFNSFIQWTISYRMRSYLPARQCWTWRTWCSRNHRRPSWRKWSTRSSNRRVTTGTGKSSSGLGGSIFAGPRFFLWMKISFPARSTQLFCINKRICSNRCWSG